MSNLLILGAGGHAKVVAELALEAGSASRVAFLDDRSSQTLLGFPILGPLDLAFQPSIIDQYPFALVAIGHSPTRLRWLAALQDAGYHLPTLIHPTAWISPTSRIGPGSVVFAQAAVQTQAVIGTGVILNTGSSVDHDVQLRDGVHICPGARVAGGVMVGARSWIGIGASVLQQVCIGVDVTVGAGAAVIDDLPDGVTAKGVPARYSTT